MYADLARLLDPDVRYGDRKPQHNAELDPHWNVSFHHGLLDGPLGMGQTYATRGRVGFETTAGGASYGLTQDGRGLKLPGATSGVSTNAAGSISWWPSLTRGSIIAAFRAAWAASSPPVGNMQIGAIHNTTGGDWICQFGVLFSGALYFGWLNNGVESRVLAVSATGLWAAGDLVTIGFSYSPRGSQAFVKGRQIGSTSTPPSTFDKRNDANTVLGLGYDPKSGSNTSWQSTILNFTVLDRELDEREWGWIQQNPLSWQYRPGTIANMITPAVVPPPAGPLQTAVSMM